MKLLKGNNQYMPMSSQLSKKRPTDKTQSNTLSFNELQVGPLLETIYIKDIPLFTLKETEQLFQNGIETLHDLFYFSDVKLHSYELTENLIESGTQKVKVIGNVLTTPSVNYLSRKVKSTLRFQAKTKFGPIGVVAFNQAFIAKSMQIGKLYYIEGTYDRAKNQIIANKMSEAKNIDLGTFDLAYNLKGLTSAKFKKMIERVFSIYQELMIDIIPSEQQKKYKLMPRVHMLRNLHHPRSEAHYKEAIRTLKYEELLTFQLKLRFKHQIEKTGNGRAHKINKPLLKKASTSLEFILTEDQMRVLSEITHDLSQPSQMYRLLQGDVGSGKTIVAFLSVLSILHDGTQAMMVAPTEVLAQQHFQSATAFFERYNKRVGILSGSMKKKEKDAILELLRNGEIDFIVGTHALLEDTVQFQDLGYVITDEQHRFGVNQRKKLREKGNKVDILYLSATPIPRTLSISYFGDLDLSTIRSMPVGRLPIETVFFDKTKIEKVYTSLKKELKKGHQAYVITPLIEESEVLDVENVQSVHAQLQEQFPDYQVGLLHGRLKSAEKDEILQKFYQNEIHILVSTTVVEVGVNVPNATVIAIYDAQRFGLAQLHQLRGRVGRSDKQSYCYVIGTKEAKKRLNILTETTDGFKIAERDLEVRGPGDFFGNRQSGLPEFKFASIVDDKVMLEYCRQESKMMLEHLELIAIDYQKYFMKKALEVND
ncbi:MAG: ATP-dependent DNA helicase RecG [Culicoidibacterales bacterium]